MHGNSLIEVGANQCDSSPEAEAWVESKIHTEMNVTVELMRDTARLILLGEKARIKPPLLKNCNSSPSHDLFILGAECPPNFGLSSIQAHAKLKFGGPLLHRRKRGRKLPEERQNFFDVNS